MDGRDPHGYVAGARRSLAVLLNVMCAGLGLAAGLVLGMLVS